MQGNHPLLRVFNPPHPPKKTKMNTSSDSKGHGLDSAEFFPLLGPHWKLLKFGIFFVDERSRFFCFFFCGKRFKKNPQYFFCLNMMGFDSRCMQFFFSKEAWNSSFPADPRSFRLWGLRMRSKFLVPRWWSTCQQVQRFPWRCPTCRWRKDKSLRRRGRCGQLGDRSWDGCNHVTPKIRGVTNGGEGWKDDGCK